MKVHIFIPCFIDQFFPQTGVNMIRVLTYLGYHILSEKLPLCCGQAAYNAGFNEEACALYQQLLHHYIKEPAPIIVPSASCAAFLKYNAPKLKEKQIKENNIPIYEFTDFIAQHTDFSEYTFTYPHKVAYHSSCASRRMYPIQDKVKEVLSYVHHLDLISIPQNEVCCGFGGSFAIKFGSISASMAEEKLKNILSVHTHKMLSTDMSCLLHLTTYASQHSLEPLHIADLLAAAIPE